LPENDYKVVRKVDFANAFNSIKRDKMLIEIKNEFPLLYPFLDQSYRQSPMTFRSTIQPLVKKVTVRIKTFGI
jgi:hypothetical protein